MTKSPGSGTQLRLHAPDSYPKAWSLRREIEQLNPVGSLQLLVSASKQDAKKNHVIILDPAPRVLGAGANRSRNQKQNAVTIKSKIEKSRLAIRIEIKIQIQNFDANAFRGDQSQWHLTQVGVPMCVNIQSESVEYEI